MITTQVNQPDVDPFLCTCGPCKRFWKENFGASSDLVTNPAITRSKNTSIIFDSIKHNENHPGTIRFGDRVMVKGKYPGTVKYVGTLKDSVLVPEAYVGVQLDDNIGSVHNGVFNGKRYFHCPRGHGAMVSYTEVRRLTLAETRPPLRGNPMFPSYKEVLKKRESMRERESQFDMIGASYNPGSRPPTYNGSSTLTSVPTQRRQPKTIIFDKNDVAIKDALRKEQAQRERFARAIEARKAAQEEYKIQTMQKWKEKFGSGKRGERLAKTLQKLHHAYKEGEEHKRKEERGELDLSEEEGEETDEERTQAS